MLYSLQKRKNRLRIQRKKRIRGKIFGTLEKPRLSIFKSNKYFYAQVINDLLGNTLASVNSRVLGLKANKKDVVIVAQKFADTLKEKNINEVIFDRNGYLYHGVVAAFANSLRESGIKI